MREDVSDKPDSLDTAPQAESAVPGRDPADETGQPGAARSDEAPIATARFGARHLVGVLAFDAGSIRAAAACPWSLLVGLLLVLSGGIARHYDQADLIRQWQLPLRGVAVSIVNATALYGLCSIVMLARGRRWSAGRAYLGFLGVFWLTAPMAWLYGIPYETWMEPARAVEANLLTLGAVSIWRVALIARVVCVLFGMSGAASLFLVLAFADTAAVFALAESGSVVLDSMGGLQRTPEERRAQVVAFQGLFWGCATWPIWAIGAVVVFRRASAVWRLGRPEGRGVPWGAIVVASAAVAAWSAIASRGHEQQRWRYEVETLLREGDAGGVHELLSTLPEERFPRNWRLREADRAEGPTLWALMAEIDRELLPPWAMELLMPHIHRRARGALHFEVVMETPWRAMPEAIESSRVGFGDALSSARRWLEFLWRHDTHLAEEDRRAVLELIRMADPTRAAELEAGPGVGGVHAPAGPP